MADDGLLVSFNLNEGTSIAVPPELRGGRWRDRQRLKKRHRRYEQKYTEQPEGENEKTHEASDHDEEGKQEDVVEPPVKRFKQDSKDHPKSRGSSNKKPPSSEVISSLFTSNPAPKAGSGDSHEPSRKHPGFLKPSNAPLQDELAAFKTLGLGDVLAAHLKAKLELAAPTAVQSEAISKLLSTDSDAFLQAETGSGKTLAYLLPIIQRITGLARGERQDDERGSTRLHRDSGLFAIVLAPTRELCKQIYTVLQRVLQCAHWIVPGIVVGGEKKKSEKSRLRKGVNILVATPGRMVDHLANTEVLDVSQVRWLVLDEGDRLMELGFEDAIQDIVTKLERRRRELSTSRLQGFPGRRITVLCSATMRMNVQRLGEISLKDAIHIRVDPSMREESGKANESSEAPRAETSNGGEFSAPAQLRQSYVVVPAKQRLVALAALLKHESHRASKKSVGSKAIVFISCADSVDFHFAVLARQPPTSSPPPSSPSPQASAAGREAPRLSAPSVTALASTQSKLLASPTIALAPLLEPHDPSGPPTTVYKLHGSLPQPVRTATLAAFARHPAAGPAVLLTTDLAARGLDLPAVDRVVEFDPAASFADHVHRVGRTARAGRPGEATVFLLPGGEEEYAALLEGRRPGAADSTPAPARHVERREAADVLRRAFAPPADSLGKSRARTTWAAAATDWQLAAERWVLASPRAAALARAGFVGHVRAYATHVAAERAVFDKEALHLGHLAKAFALRERPVGFVRKSGAGGKREKGKLGRVVKGKAGREERRKDGNADGGVRDMRDDKDVVADAAEVKREEAVRKMRAGMKARMSAADEFNIG